jgi:hypothetical protein
MSTIIVERVFSDPQEFEEIEALETKFQWCLDAHSVRFVRSFFSLDRKLMHCIYEAPDAESVREAQSKAGLPFTRVWVATEVCRS